jgi:hypothetical protein
MINGVDYRETLAEGRRKSKRTIQATMTCDKSKETTEKTPTLWDVVNTVMDEAGREKSHY